MVRRSDILLLLLPIHSLGLERVSHCDRISIIEIV